LAFGNGADKAREFSRNCGGDRGKKGLKEGENNRIFKSRSKKTEKEQEKNSKRLARKKKEGQGFRQIRFPYAERKKC